MVNDNGRDILPDGEVVIISSMVPNKDKEVIIENIRRLAYGERGEPLLILRIPASPAFSILYPALFDEDNITKWALRKAGDSKPELTAKEWLRSILFEVIEMADVRRGFDRIPLETASKLHPLMVK